MSISISVSSFLYVPSHHLLQLVVSRILPIGADMKNIHLGICVSLCLTIFLCFILINKWETVKNIHLGLVQIFQNCLVLPERSK